MDKRTASKKETSAPTISRRRYVGALGLGISVVSGWSIPSGHPDPTVDRTLIATWRGGDPIRAVTLQWLRDREAAETTTVRLSARDGSDVTSTTSVAPFGDADFDRIRADITGLQPDTEYEISIGDRQTDYSVRTAPSTLDEPIVFAEGGDIGTTDVVSELHAKAASWDPLFAVVGGDLAYANGRGSTKWIAFLEDWHEHMRADGRLIPIVAAIGNHEVRGGIDGTPADAPFYYSLFDNTHRKRAYWTLDLGSYLSIVLLDSNHTTPIPGAQTEWFRETIQSRTDRQHLMAAYHVPAYPSAKPITGAGRKRADVRKHWPPVLETFDVDVAFEHDDHAYKRTHPLRDGERHPEGVLYLGDGAWGIGTREVHTPEERPYLARSSSTLNVIRVEIQPDGTQMYRAVDESGETVDTYHQSV